MQRPWPLRLSDSWQPAGGGGDATTEGAAAPETLPETALFSAETASRLQMLTNAGPFEESTDEAARREDYGYRWWLDNDTTQLRGDALAALAREHRRDVEWHDIPSKHGLTLEGNRAGSNRALRVNMDHGDFDVFTTDAMGGGIAAHVYADLARGVPNASGTWRGLMIGAVHDGRDLLQGDAEISFDFDEMTVDASFTGIVNLDRMAAHSRSRVDFPPIPVSDQGIWERGVDTDEGIRGGFAGTGHEEAGGYFWTPDMTASFGAARQ
ncbi:MAG: hypothetical protein OXH76_20015 [Boseongicola sp.]|nr:hypothetical protein [Boseongicola sp.]